MDVAVFEGENGGVLSGLHRSVKGVMARVVTESGHTLEK